MLHLPVTCVDIMLLNPYHRHGRL